MLLNVLLMLSLLAIWSCQFEAWAQGRLRDRIRARFEQTNQDRAGTSQSQNIAGLDVAIWRPPNTNGQPVPLVIFSHGFHGRNTQSVSIMQALSSAGYLVLAPNHKDAIGTGRGVSRLETPFRDAAAWSDRNFEDRKEDINKLVTALQSDHRWKTQINWSQVALAGHSLGGYTVLGLAGAWPAWKMNGVKAVLALSPYTEPFVLNGTLNKMDVPVMYQTGTRDFGVAPFIMRKGGAFEKTSPPAYLVVINKAAHHAWSNFQRDENQQNLISYYCVSFLDRFVKGDATAKPEKQLNSSAAITVK